MILAHDGRTQGDKYDGGQRDCLNSSFHGLFNFIFNIRLLSTAPAGALQTFFKGMKPFAPIALMLALLAASCGKTKTTDTVSSQFATLAEKQEFLERYMKFRRSYDELHFHLSFIDGNSGRVPGPTEWNVRVLAVVPAGEIDQWTDGLRETSDPELDWISDIPNAPTDFSRYKWYEGDRVIVGVDREGRSVLYWNHAS